MLMFGAASGRHPLGRSHGDLTRWVMLIDLGRMIHSLIGLCGEWLARSLAWSWRFDQVEEGIGCLLDLQMIHWAFYSLVLGGPGIVLGHGV